MKTDLMKGIYDPKQRTQYFPPELRTASVVPRWSVVFTLMKDHIANHSFYVALYSRQIAKMIAWKAHDKDYFEAFYLLVMKALIHDLDETVTGDIVSPVKREILDEARAADYIDAQMARRLPAIHGMDGMIDAFRYAAEINLIVKAADRLDALLFLITERRMGNKVIEDRLPLAWKNLEDAWEALPCNDQILMQLWENLQAEILEHTRSGGNGV